MSMLCPRCFLCQLCAIDKRGALEAFSKTTTLIEQRWVAAAAPVCPLHWSPAPPQSPPSARPFVASGGSLFFFFFIFIVQFSLSLSEAIGNVFAEPVRPWPGDSSCCPSNVYGICLHICTYINYTSAKAMPMLMGFLWLKIKIVIKSNWNFRHSIRIPIAYQR